MHDPAPEHQWSGPLPSGRGPARGAVLWAAGHRKSDGECTQGPREWAHGQTRSRRCHPRSPQRPGSNPARASPRYTTGSCPQTTAWEATSGEFGQCPAQTGGPRARSLKHRADESLPASMRTPTTISAAHRAEQPGELLMPTRIPVLFQSEQPAYGEPAALHAAVSPPMNVVVPEWATRDHEAGALSALGDRVLHTIQSPGPWPTARRPSSWPLGLDGREIQEVDPTAP
jgi:hypothetical protein